MKKTAGYALLEVVLCIAISTIIITGTAVAFGNASRMNALAREKLHAEIAVQNAAETVLAEGYSTATEVEIKEISNQLTISETTAGTNSSKVTIQYVKKDKDNNDIVLAEIVDLNVKKNPLTEVTP